jgi:transcriptional regulator with XRE-family HTH domain
MSSLGEKIKEIRGKESRTDFAARFAIHANTLLRWENGERQPDIEFLKKIILEYGISPEWLIFGEGEKDAPIAEHEVQTIPRDYYANLLDENNELRKQNSYLWPKVEGLTKENGELRVEIEKLKAKISLLEK